ncbi:tryptophan synthase beta subunit-like PLP-dependent enzyme [Blyttiomyces helicus]|uniref:threonine ammonia-lyase n=1 Tax=Blyttiomyces helicus TaxID=388810 RepID=A0A4P9W9Z3_9FUNG|nr:tryptophan synthase beta subunit-like PLP-dependent enzyme [Blyttiomyces helicus]|eukprot:RKO88313.1 tryptophan synthase beta subunit-like PLP-dependent enzyme [Blyttiomyces helicus]
MSSPTPLEMLPSRTSTPTQTQPLTPLLLDVLLDSSARNMMNATPPPPSPTRPDPVSYVRNPSYGVPHTTPTLAAGFILPDYLRLILTASVYDVAIESPLQPAINLSARLGAKLLLKREDLQPVFSFKLRGAFNKMRQLSDEERARGVVACSAGNHAQGVALAASKLGIRAIIVMPVVTPPIKWRNVRRLGAEVVLFGNDFDEAKAECARLAAVSFGEGVGAAVDTGDGVHERWGVEQSAGVKGVRRQRSGSGVLGKACAISDFRRFAKTATSTFPPTDDPYVIAGQGTVGVEILRQCSSPITAIFVCVGGGGLISGIASYVKRLHPRTRIIGVETYDADAMTRSLLASERITLPHVGLFADGAAVRSVGEETFRIAREFVDGMVRVSTDEICAAIKDAFEDTRSILEPAGALGLAGAKKYIAEMRDELPEDATFVAIASGANMNFDRLRFVAERAELGENREALITVSIPEKPGR